MALPATIICWAFIAWLIIRDLKRRPAVSVAVWIPTLMFFSLATRNPSGWFGQRAVVTGLSNDASGLLVDQLFLLLMIVASLALLFSRGLNWGRLFTANTALMLFYAYFALSSLWSNYPGDSLIRVLKDFSVTVIVAAVILSEKDPIEAVRAIYVRCACAMLPLSMLFIRYYPAYGRVYARAGETTYTGVATQKNSFGQLIFISIFFLVWDHLETQRPGAKRVWSGMKWDRLVLIGMGAWLLNLSQSKTSLMCLSIGLIILLGTRWISSPAISRTVFVTALSLPVLVVATQEFTSIIAPALASIGRDATFTGRTDIWQHITLTTVNPLLGAGFYTFWGGPGGRAIQLAMQTEVPNAHNGYLDLYLDGGFVGLVLLFILLSSASKRLTKNLRMSRFQRVRFAFLIIAIIGNLTESNWGRPAAIWFTTVLMVIDFPKMRAQMGRMTRQVAGVPYDFNANMENPARPLQQHHFTRPALPREFE